MSGFGYGLAGFANGIAQGVSLGQQIRSEMQQAELAKVRAQGIAEAQAAQAAATPKITDLGDQDNLTSNPQQSVDPNMAPEPVNTSLPAFIQGAQDAQANPDDSPRASGIQTYPVDQPDSTPIDPDKLSSVPQSSQAPNTQQTATNDPADNLDANAKAGTVPLTPSKRFVVDGQGFDTQEDAAAYVRKQTPQLESFFKDTLIPKMTATLIAQGKPDQAQAWEQYADQEQTRQNMATWAKAVKLAQLQDYDGSASELMKLHPHFDDGYDLISAKPTTGDDGESGFTMTVRAPDGSTQQIYQNSKSLTEMGLPQLSPIEMFNQMYKRQVNADTLEAKAGFDQQNDERTMKRALAVAGVQAGARQQVAQTQVQGRQAVADSRNQTLQNIHASDNDARMARMREGWAARAQLDAQRIAQQGQYRKAVSPEERQAIIVSSLAKDPMFNTLTPEQKKQRVADTMALIPASPAGGAARPPVVNPFNNGIGAPSAPQQSIPAPGGGAPAGKVAVPVFDPASGTIKTVYR